MNMIAEYSELFPIHDAEYEEPLQLLDSTVEQAVSDGLVDYQVACLLWEEGDEPVCPVGEKPFVPTPEQRLEGRAQQVADDYTFITRPGEIVVVNPAKPESSYRITRAADGVPTCDCIAYYRSYQERICKHVLALSILEMEIPAVGPEPMRMELAAVPAPVLTEFVPGAELLARMGWDGGEF